MAVKKTTSSKVQFQPLGGYVLIQPEEEEKTTASGIVLPDTHTGEKPQQGKVIAVGGSYLHESGTEVNSPVKVGDTVIYKKWGGNEYKQTDGKELIFVKFDDLLAVVG